MAKYLVKTVETYRVGTENEAQTLINEAKVDKSFTLAKYASEKRQVKQKGVIADEWVRVTLTKDFNVEKEPDCYVEVEYNVNRGFFPSPVDDDEDEELF